MGLKLHGLVAIKLHSPLSLNEVATRLNIKLDFSVPAIGMDDIFGLTDNRIGCTSNLLIMMVEDHFGLYTIDEMKEFDKSIFETFSTNQICAVLYYSVSDLYGYTYFEYGNRIRTKYGILDEIWVDYGEEFEGVNNENDQGVIDFLLTKVAGYPSWQLHRIDVPLTKFTINN